MRILHLFASPYWSGPAENIALLATAQRELGHEVTVAIDRKRTTADAEELGLPHFLALGLLDDRGLELSVKSGPGRIWSDLRTLRRHRADVLHTHFSHDHFLARWSRKRGQIIVRSIHSPRSIRLTMPYADGLTVTTGGEQRYFPGRPTMVLPALVGSEFTPPRNKKLLREELGLKGNPLVGMASTFKKSRRHRLGLRAFVTLRQAVPSARMLLIGDGAQRAAIQLEVERLSLNDAVQFSGYVSGLDYIKRLQSLDVLWVLGLGNDWTARLAAQANACAVPVVGVNEGALPSLVDSVAQELTPAAVAAASLSAKFLERARRTNLQIASEVIEFYAGLQEQRGREHRRRGFLDGFY